MKVALRQFAIEGIAHTIPFHLEILDDPFFRRGRTVNGLYRDPLSGQERSLIVLGTILDILWVHPANGGGQSWLIRKIRRNWAS